jgi:type IX secretion system PorP/SprF family membrane protein
MKKPGAFILFILMAVVSNAQQQPIYSHYMFSSVGFNPAVSGNKDQFVLQSSYRLQWLKIDGSPRTLMMSIDGPVYKDRLSMAIDLDHDKIGDQSVSMGYASVAYRLKLNDANRLSFGLAGGVENHQIDKSKLTEQDPGDPVIQQLKDQYISPDARAGIYFSNNSFYAGLSVVNLLSTKKNDPAYSIENKQRSFLFTTGYLHRINSSVNIYPSLLYKEDFILPSSFTATLLFQFNQLVYAGLAYHTGFNVWNDPPENHYHEVLNNLTLLCDIELNQRFRLGYAYDYGFSPVYSNVLGSHEISLSYFFEGRKHYRIMNPRFL